MAEEQSSANEWASSLHVPSFMQGCPAEYRCSQNGAECLSREGRCRSRADMLSHAIPPGAMVPLTDDASTPTSQRL